MILSLGPTDQSYLLAFLQFDVTSGRWASPNDPPLSPLLICQVDVYVWGAPGCHVLRPGCHKWPCGAEYSLPHRLEFTQMRNKLLIKPVKPEGLSVTAAATTLSNELDDTRGEF